MPPTLALVFGVLVFCTCAVAAILLLRPRSRQRETRLADAIERRGFTRLRAAPASRQRLSSFVGSLRAQLGVQQSAQVRERFQSAGVRGSDALELHFAARLLGPVAGIIAGSFCPGDTLLWIIVLAGVGYLAPNFWLDRRVARRRERIRRSIPDAVDLLVICVDAGLGLDQALLRTGQELAVSYPEITAEFAQINREQRAGHPRLEAWRRMADRTGLMEIQAFVSMLVQTERFGTPIARALAQFSDDLRLKRRQAAEEKAAKTSVKMLFPLVVFIFPCIFIVLLGPAFITVSKGLFTMTR